MDDGLLPPTELLVRRLFELVCTPFTLSAWQERWSRYGWMRDSWESDPYGFRVTLPEGWVLQVDPVGDRLIGASLPFYYWEDYDSKFHEEIGKYDRQKKLYDAQFDAASGLAVGILPEPFLRWTDADQRAHRAIAWEGTMGILILQQASFDPQFGIEVNFWLTNCARRDFQPQTPLIDVLTEHSRRIHDKEGFPPLR